ncbi:MAG: hypothetical protein ACXAE3_07415 [Candidatus Kariarchaeaceae archaeon]|jgi:hypothetical protein
MEYSLYKAFVAYVTYMEHYRNLEAYRKGAKVIRNGLPEIDKSKQGWRNILEVKNFVEMVLTEEDAIVDLIAQDDGAATIEALTEDSKTIMMSNTDEISSVIFGQN